MSIVDVSECFVLDFLQRVKVGYGTDIEGDARVGDGGYYERFG